MNVGMRPGTKSILLLTLLAILATATLAQAQNGIAGKWRNEQEGPNGKVVTIWEFQQGADGRWTGTARSSANPGETIPLERLQVNGDDVEFQINHDVPDQSAKLKTEFKLKHRSAENLLKGSVQASIPGVFDRTTDVELTRMVEKAGASGMVFQPSRPILGAWSARPDKDDKEREIQLEVLADGSSYKGTITDTSADETIGLRDLVVKDNTVSYNFRFDGAPFMSSFWGRYDSEKDRLRGSMSIGGRSQPLVFERVSAGPESLDDEFGDEKPPLPIKHFHKFAVSGRLAYWQPLYMVKENIRNINDITTGGTGFDIGARWHLIDYLAMGLRYSRGGLNFDTNETNLGLFDPVTGDQGDGLSHALNTDSTMPMDSIEFTITGYLGPKLTPNSKFNPYIVGLAGKTTWEVNVSGRGSEVIGIYGEPLEGSTWTFGAGLGTEYAFNHRWGLEFDWIWTYSLTEDETKWEDVTYQWTNQHVFRFSLGACVWF